MLSTPCLGEVSSDSGGWPGLTARSRGGEQATERAVRGAPRLGRRVPQSAPDDMADTRPATQRHFYWATRRENRTNATQRHHEVLDPLCLATSAFPLLTAAPGVGSYQELSKARRNFTAVPVGGSMTVPR